MRIRETHATLGESVKIWRVDFGFGVIARDVAIAHVVSKNQNDIGWGSNRDRSQGGDQKGAECKFGFHTSLVFIEIESGRAVSAPRKAGRFW